jgi:hypothetical protein
MQASSLIKTFNSCVQTYDNAMDELNQAQQSAMGIWGDIDRLKNVSLYNMDTWTQGLNTINYGIVQKGMIGTIANLEAANTNFVKASLNGFNQPQNDISYNAHYAGIAYAFHAYYNNDNWETYKSKNPTSTQTQTILNQNAATQSKIIALRSYACSPNMTQSDCNAAVQANQVQIKEFQLQIDDNNNQIDAQFGSIGIDRLFQTSEYARNTALTKIMTRIHLSSVQYANRLANVQDVAAKVQARVRKILSGRISTPAKVPTPDPSSSLTPVNVAEVCSYPENLIVPGMNGQDTSCIFAHFRDANKNWIPDANSAQTPTSTYDPTDLQADPSDETPRAPTIEDFATLRAMIAYISLEQEQILFDIESDNTLLSMHLLLEKGTKTPSSSRNIQSQQEAMGMALLVGKINNLPKTDILSIWNNNNLLHTPWDPGASLQSNLQQ